MPKSSSKREDNDLDKVRGGREEEEDYDAKVRVVVWVGEIACLPGSQLTSTSYDCGETSRARSLRFALGRKSMPTSIREKSDQIQWDSVSPQKQSYPVVWLSRHTYHTFPSF